MFRGWPCDSGQHQVCETVVPEWSVTNFLQSFLLPKTMQEETYPAPLYFFAATMLWAFLQRLYISTSPNDNYQIHAVVLASICGIATGMSIGLSLPASLLCLVPCCIYGALLLSDVLHFGAWRYLMIKRNELSTDDGDVVLQEKRQAGHEKVLSEIA